jgi:NDP-sugar pyrophosphorylase family protein
MAAGEGRRLRPLSERFAKPVLPIDGRPVLATLLRELEAAGVERAYVVTGHLGKQVERLVGDGSAFGLDVSFVRQPSPLGSADAVLRAVRAGAQAPLLVTAADTVFTRGDVARFVEAWRTSGAEGAVAVRRAPPPSRRMARTRAARCRSTRVTSTTCATRSPGSSTAARCWRSSRVGRARS